MGVGVVVGVVVVFGLEFFVIGKFLFLYMKRDLIYSTCYIKNSLNSLK